jgi:hypothetical protein
VLRPLAAVFCSAPRAGKWLMSLRAVSCEHFAMAAPLLLHLMIYKKIILYIM